MTNRIIHVRTVAGTVAGTEAYTTGIGDIALSGGSVYSTNGATGGVATWAPATGTRATTPYGAVSGAAPELAKLTLSGAPALLSMGQANGLTRLYSIAADGSLGAPRTLDFGDRPVIAAAALPASGAGDLIFTTCLGGAGIDAFRLTASGLTKIGTTNMGGNAHTYDLTALTAAKVGAATFLVATSSMDAALSVFQVGASGGLTMTDRLVPAEGFYVANPEVLDTVTFSGETFVLAGSAGSGSLSVMSLGADGVLTVRDQVNDQLGTRFASPSALETLRIGDHAFVAIAGGDDGVTLFRLLPDGRLVLLDAIEDTAGAAGTALADVSGLAMRAMGTHLEIYAAGRADAGLSQFRVDLGALGVVTEGTANAEVLHGTNAADVLLGAAGDDTLYGHDGADLLVDGAGIDRLYGGAGADIFSLRSDGNLDVISDFEAGVDRLDLSEWGPVTELDTTRFYSTARGAEIMWHGERLVLQSQDGAPIPLAALRPFFDGFSHAMTDAISGDLVLLGSARADLLVGGIGNDDLQGGTGADHLIGGEGDDILRGGEIHPLDTTSNLVFRIYQATLGRAPDAAGLADWVDLLDSGARSIKQVISGFVNSREFRGLYGDASDADFVDLLYNNVLGRAGDAGGQAYWTQQIVSGQVGRADVVQGFAASPEFIGRTATDALSASFSSQMGEWSDEVFRLYRATLGRAPDTAGLTYWAQEMAGGADLGDVIGGFVRSREFQDRYGETDASGFVDLLYENVLGRAGDPGGQAFWTERITSGVRTRADVVEGFSESPEFKGQSAPILKNWMRTTMADDRIEGEGGTNTLVGGIGADTFVFSPATGGTHLVADFEDWDILSLEGFGYTGLADVRAHMTYVSGDVVFADQGVRVVLHNTHPSELTTDDFDFG